MNKISEMRRKARLSKAELARECGLSRCTIIRVEQGGNTTLRTLQAIERVCLKRIHSLESASRPR